ncbi:hypothetical protein E0W68_09955 [Flavobacterium salilacus subsp. salilacus]|uniref:hypothetical protein n=1 Tax=Flavobacterium TaxID=237 RepID=UPI0010750F80|nr:MULTISPECIES: hypothetical protein [Flavobacterium]KAF2518335.1 hypothetical protein E0W68_09955 [Flavobacterium salilacus subsp. salilacus]MBE1615250.1 hypothetical protein [Flavobacterium sp. SaA2.13]
MKKLFLFLLGIVFLTSCSSDTQESIKYDDTSIVTNSMTQDQLMPKSTIDPVLKQLYVEMINSQSYIDYDNSRVAFYEKLGDNIPDSEMDSENKMLTWIQNNITQTGFQNYQEAVDKHEDVVALGIAAIEANLTFHEYLAGAAPGALIPILDELQPVPTRCSGCVKAYNNCVSIANSEYGTAMQQASQSFTEGGGVFNYSNQRGYTLSTDNAYYDMIRSVKMCSIHFEACCEAA